MQALPDVGDGGVAPGQPREHRRGHDGGGADGASGGGGVGGGEGKGDGGGGEGEGGAGSGDGGGASGGGEGSAALGTPESSAFIRFKICIPSLAGTFFQQGKGIEIISIDIKDILNILNIDNFPIL